MNSREVGAFGTTEKDRHETVGLSNALKNRLTEVIKRYEIKLPDIESMLGSVEVTDYDVYKVAEVNKISPMVLSALIGKDQGFQDIDTYDMPDAIKCIAEHVGNRESFEDVVISVGMGGSIVMPNVRAPAYIMPAIKSLSSMAALMKKGEIKGVPRVKVFKADHIAALVNNFDLQRVHDVSELTFEFLKDFINRFYPKLTEYFTFDIDTELSQGDLSEFSERAEHLRSSTKLADQIASIVKMGEKHGGEEGIKNAFLYAAAHPYYNRSIVKRSKTSSTQTDNSVPKLIIDHGGRPQKTFNEISRLLISESRGRDGYLTPPTIHMIVKSGKIPVYYSARDGDLPIGAHIDGIDYKKLDRSTHVDYKEIFSEVAEPEFVEFVNEFNKKHAENIDRAKMYGGSLDKTSG